MKVARIITRLNIGGPAVHAVLLTRELRARGYETVLIAGRCEEQDGDMSYILGPDDRVEWVPQMSRSARPLANLAALWRLYRVLRAHRPEIVHTHTAMAGCLGRLAALAAGAPVLVHTFHGNSLSGYFSRFGNAVFCRIERGLARFTDALCVVAPQQARELSERFRVAPPEKFRVVPLGLDLEPYLALPPCPDDGLRAGWFGRLVPVKGVPLLIAAIEETLRRSGDVRFLIAGDGPEGPLLSTALARFGGRVEWLGWQQDVRPALARCHVLIQTSHNEGTPLALIQGMAAGRPFVSTPAGGIADMAGGPQVAASGGCRWFENAVLVQARPAAFASALERLARDRVRLAKMGEAARRLARKRYASQRLVDDLDRLYRSLIQRKHPQSIFASAPIRE